MFRCKIYEPFRKSNAKLANCVIGRCLQQTIDIIFLHVKVWILELVLVYHEVSSSTHERFIGCLFILMPSFANHLKGHIFRSDEDEVLSATILGVTIYVYRQMSSTVVKLCRISRWAYKLEKSRAMHRYFDDENDFYFSLKIRGFSYLDFVCSAN